MHVNSWKGSKGESDRREKSCSRATPIERLFRFGSGIGIWAPPMLLGGIDKERGLFSQALAAPENLPRLVLPCFLSE